MDRVFPASRRLNKVVSPVVSRSRTCPVAGDEVFGATERFYDRLDGVRDLLTDPRSPPRRLVVNPERMVIAEARRTFTYLSLFGYHVDAVVANRCCPSDHRPLVPAVEGAAGPAPHHHRGGLRPAAGPAGRARPDELVGLERLRSFATDLYRDLDATAVFHPGSPLEVRKRATPPS